MYKHLLVTALVLLALQSLGGEQLPETSAPKRVNAARGFRPQIRGGLHRAAADAQSGNLPPIVKQFEETSYYLKDIAMLDANTGWAVGEPYWDPTAKQYKGTIIKTTNSGTAWTAQDAGVVETFSGLRFVDANQGWVVGANGAILHTRDGGDHWSNKRWRRRTSSVASRLRMPKQAGRPVSDPCTMIRLEMRTIGRPASGTRPTGETRGSSSNSQLTPVF
jgi:hypothetical protein